MGLGSLGWIKDNKGQRTPKNTVTPTPHPHNHTYTVYSICVTKRSNFDIIFFYQQLFATCFLKHLFTQMCQSQIRMNQTLVSQFGGMNPSYVIRHETRNTGSVAMPDVFCVTKFVTEKSKHMQRYEAIRGTLETVFVHAESQDARKSR